MEWHNVADGQHCWPKSGPIVILMGILALSDDILIEILYFLSPIDVSFGLSATSRHFYNLSNLEKLWQNYCLKYNYQQKGRTKRLLKPWKHVYLTNICLNCSNREKNNGNIIIDCNGGNSKRSSNGMVNQHLISLCSHCFQSVESYHDLSSRMKANLLLGVKKRLPHYVYQLLLTKIPMGNCKKNKTNDSDINSPLINDYLLKNLAKKKKKKEE